MKLNKIMLITLCCFTFLACESTEEKIETSAMDLAKSAIASAKSALSIVTKNNYSWKSTKKILKEAESSFDKKDFIKAINLAEKAETQAVLAEKQRQQQLAEVAKMF